MSDESSVELRAAEGAARVWSGRLARVLPVLAFATGFLFDSITLGRGVTTADLVLVSLYAVFGFVLLGLERRPWREPRHHRWVVNGIQFVLGALFSATTVLYFRSAGALVSIVFVGSLFGVMVANEKLHKGGPVSGVIWGLYAVALALISNFVIPYVVGSISVVWLFLALAGSVLAVQALHRATSMKKTLLRAPFFTCGAVALIHLAGGVPPVPLVDKNALVCTNFEKVEGDYTCEVDEPGFWQWLGWDPVVTVVEGDAAWALSAIFAPDRVETTIEHRWSRRSAEGWQRVSTMEFEMRGGRRAGWRVYSKKRSISPGKWRVETALKDGAVLGYQEFEVVRGEAPKQRKAL